MRHHILCRDVLEHLRGGSMWRVGRYTAQHVDAFGGQGSGHSFGGQFLGERQFGEHDHNGLAFWTERCGGSALAGNSDQLHLKKSCLKQLCL